MDWRAHIARYGRVALPGERWMRITFLTLLALAAVLRFWDLPHLPYTHDEISALVRIYPSLWETIQRGVIELDTHPPGVQVFEWLWTKLFSMQEPDVKLPFIAMSLAAIFLLYRFAITWTGAAPALLLTTLMATLQYSVMYGQIARPYAAGLFMTALLADQLTRYLAFGHRRALIGVGIAAVLSAYTHHFALMLAAIMVITGLLLVKPGQRKAYLIMCVVCALLYLPNVPILMKQLGLGGLAEWLAPPGADWMTNYAWYIAHWSVPFAVLLSIVVLVATVLHIKHGAPGPSMRMLLAWGSLPLIIGIGYSVWRAPVIQYSVVLFSFPYVTLALISGLRSLDKRYTIGLCALVAFTSVWTLNSSRHHYDLFYTSKYETIVREGQEALAEHGPDGTLVLIDAPDHVIRFYLGLWKIDPATFPYEQLRDGTTGRLDSALIAAHGRVIAYGQSNGARPENAALIQQRFRYLLERRDLVDGQTFLFADKPGSISWYDRDTIASALPDGRRLGTWEIADDMLLVKDSLQHSLAWDYSGREYGASIAIALDSLHLAPQEQLEVVAQVENLGGLVDAAIIADMKAGDSTVFYRGGDLVPLLRGPGSASLVVAVHPTDGGRANGPLMLKTYVYNRSKGALRVKRIDVLRRATNPVVYGTLEPVPWLGRFR